MPSTYQSLIINVPITKVWNTIKDFQNLDWAPNVITKCDAVGAKSGTEVGAKRILNEVFHETLISFDERNHRLQYSIDDGPSPVSPAEVRHYVGEVHLLPVTKNDTTFIEWASCWESTSEDAVDFCHSIYVALLDDLAQTLAGTAVR